MYKSFETGIVWTSSIYYFVILFFTSMSSVYIFRCFLANCCVYTRYWNTCIVRYKFIYVYGVVCSVVEYIFFCVHIYIYCHVSCVESWSCFI